MSTTERTYRNELPDGATAVRAIRRHQRHDFNQDEIEQMVIDYTENQLTVYQLADKYGCHRTTVSNVLKRNGVVVTNKRMNNDQIETAKQLYADGLTLKQVGQQLGVSESTMNRILRLAGVEIRQSHRYSSEERKRHLASY